MVGELQSMDPPGQSREDREKFEGTARSVLAEASSRGLVLRLIGSLAFRFQCPRYGHLQTALGRAYTDIDFVAYSKQSVPVGQLFRDLGFSEESEVNLIF